MGRETERGEEGRKVEGEKGEERRGGEMGGPFFLASNRGAISLGLEVAQLW
jgi:hypothetical protein